MYIILLYNISIKNNQSMAQVLRFSLILLKNKNNNNNCYKLRFQILI